VSGRWHVLCKAVVMTKHLFSAKRMFFIWVALALLLSWGGSADAGGSDTKEIRVAVASNFIAPLKELAKTFEAATAVRVLVSAGSTGKLYAQIHNGAPFDVFLAANAREPARLVEQSLGIAHTRFTYARGRLALWCRTANTSEQARACLDGPDLRLAIANPRLAPYGQAAQSALAALRPSRPVVTGENISQAFQLVWSGNVPLGFVALSQLKSRTDIPGAYWLVPTNYHDPIDQQAVLLKRAIDNADAQAFVQYLQSDAARAVIESYGYDMPSSQQAKGQ